MQSHRHHGTYLELNLGSISFRVLDMEGARIDCQHSILTSVGLVQHMDNPIVPVFYEAMVTIELKLESFIVEMAL